MKTIFTSILLSLVVLGFGQNTFKVATFAPDYGYLNQIIQLNDSSFVATGENFYSDYQDTGYLIKTDSKGNVLASKTIQTIAAGFSIIKTSDGGFAIVGVYNPDIKLIKFKADLTIQWQQVYTVADGSAIINKMIQTTDGGFLMAGAKDRNLNDTYGIIGYLIKTDAVGNLQFAKQYLDYNENFLVDVAATTDGNYGLLGETEHSNVSPDSSFIIKIKPDGSILWARSLVGNVSQQSENVYGMLASSDGGLVATGYLYTPDNPDQLSMIKYDNAGNLLWSKSVFASSTLDVDGDGVTEDKDGGYLFYGGLESSFNDDTSLSYIVKTNAAGVLQWTKTFGAGVSSDFEEFYSLIKTSDGGYAACGDGGSYDSSIDDYIEGGFIYKFDNNFGACNNHSTSIGTIQNSGVSAAINVSTADIITNVSTAQASLFNTATIDNICTGTLLPLNLLTFNATLQNKTVAVQWTTANEINTSYFVVERSKDAASFTALQQVAAKGNTAGVQAYNMNDVQPLSGTSYYRLKETDKDGKITYSSIVPVTVLNNGVVIISPNPVQNAIRIVMQSEGNATVTFRIVDLRGSILATQNASVTAGRNEITLPAASLAKGIYVLKVIEKNTVQTVRFVKE